MYMPRYCMHTYMYLCVYVLLRLTNIAFWKKKKEFKQIGGGQHAV